MHKKISFSHLETTRVISFSSQFKPEALSHAVLGGKGYSLVCLHHILSKEKRDSDMIKPLPGFVITTKECQTFLDTQNSRQEMDPELWRLVVLFVKGLEKETNKKMGDSRTPLFLSCRSGAAVSMPGMMDTILNIGMTEAFLDCFGESDTERRWALESYITFIQNFSEVVNGISSEELESVESDFCAEKDKERGALTYDDLKELSAKYKGFLIGKEHPVPDSWEDQLKQAVMAVFKSWDNSRAVTYRKLHQLEDKGGTAVTIMPMVFGNKNDKSGTGVFFTHTLDTGDPVITGDYCPRKQGFHIVDGQGKNAPIDTLFHSNPKFRPALENISRSLSLFHKGMLEVEFSIEDGVLYLLQTKSSPALPSSKLRFLISQLNQGAINEQYFINSFNLTDLSFLASYRVPPTVSLPVLGRGAPVSPGATTGILCTTTSQLKSASGPAIFVTSRASAKDIEAFNLCGGVLTIFGGTSSHAASIVKGIGRPAIFGFEGSVDPDTGLILRDGTVIGIGEMITMDGLSGQVFKGEVELIPPEKSAQLVQFKELLKKMSKLSVSANADSALQVQEAVAAGASDNGLTATEYLIFHSDSQEHLQKLILNNTFKRFPTSQQDFMSCQSKVFDDIFKSLQGRSWEFRTIDPPLSDIFSSSTLVLSDEESAFVRGLSEENNMIGLRGIRFSMAYKDIFNMQLQLISEASERAGRDDSIKVMLPMVHSKYELEFARKCVEELSCNITIGCMIECPAAIFTLPEILGEGAAFLSFGTNDLTQMVYRLSREDATDIIIKYQELGIIDRDPFKSLMPDIFFLMSLTKSYVESSGLDTKLSICGVQAEDPETVPKLHGIVDAVSVSVNTIDQIRLVSAQSDHVTSAPTVLNTDRTLSLPVFQPDGCSDLEGCLRSVRVDLNNYLQDPNDDKCNALVDAIASELLANLDRETPMLRLPENSLNELLPGDSPFVQSFLNPTMASNGIRAYLLNDDYCVLLASLLNRLHASLDIDIRLIIPNVTFEGELSVFKTALEGHGCDLDNFEFGIEVTSVAPLLELNKVMSESSFCILNVTAINEMLIGVGKRELEKVQEAYRIHGFPIPDLTDTTLIHQLLKLKQSKQELPRLFAMN